MSFIAKSPLEMAKIDSTPTKLLTGTRALFATANGWKDVNEDGEVSDIASVRDIDYSEIDSLNSVEHTGKMYNVIYSEDSHGFLLITLDSNSPVQMLWDPSGNFQTRQYDLKNKEWSDWTEIVTKDALPPMTNLGLLTDETMLDGIYNKGVYFYEKAEKANAVERLSAEILIVKTNIAKTSTGDKLVVTQFRLSANDSRSSQWICELDENGDLKSAVITEDGWKKWTPYVVIDSKFDDESTNTLQNKVITKKFSTIDNELTSIKNGEIVVAHSSKATKDIQGNTIHTTYATKQEIGDIETSLENIIAKYGLGGETV